MNRAFAFAYLVVVSRPFDESNGGELGVFV